MGHDIYEGFEAGEVCIYKHLREDPNIWKKKRTRNKWFNVKLEKTAKVDLQGLIGNMQD